MILIVDSEKTSEIKIKQSFNEFGLESVVVARSAEQARDVLKTNVNSKGQDLITLIVIDGELDDADGFEFCREIRKTEIGKYAYIILLVSSVKNQTKIENAKHSGASDFSVKPYNSNEFHKSFMKYLKQKVVLLVEDDPVIRKMVCRLLIEYHVEIIEIDDGIDAYNLLNTMFPVSVVLIDIGLPNMNGIKLVKQIRSKANWAKTPVVMLTASSDVSDVKKSLVAGANDYITKPFKADDFIKRIDRYISDDSRKYAYSCRCKRCISSLE